MWCDVPVPGLMLRRVIFQFYTFHFYHSSPALMNPEPEHFDPDKIVNPPKTIKCRPISLNAFLFWSAQVQARPMSNNLAGPKGPFKMFYENSIKNHFSVYVLRMRLGAHLPGDWLTRLADWLGWWLGLEHLIWLRSGKIWHGNGKQSKCNNIC